MFNIGLFKKNAFVCLLLFNIETIKFMIYHHIEYSPPYIPLGYGDTMSDILLQLQHQKYIWGWT